LYAQSIFYQGRIPQTEALLEPTLKINSAFRGVARQLAIQQPDAAVAQRWLTKVQSVTPADAQDERVALAAAWGVLAKTSKDASVKQNAARSIADADTVLASAKESPSAASWTALASVKETANDVEGAVAAYRNALKADPDEPIAQNNLAMIIIRQGGQIEEATSLAKSAASRESHPLCADFLDTLALVQQKAGKLDQACDAINKAVQKRPSDPNLRSDQVEILLDAHQIPAARESMIQLNAVMRGVTNPDQRLVDRVRLLNERLLKLATTN
jgi:Tfp pilus assembly protein PilF